MKKYLKFILICIIFICNVGCNSNHDFVLGSTLSEQDSNRLILMLSQNGIDAIKQKAKDGTYSLLIANGNKDEAIKVMLSNGIPSNKFTNLGEMFKKDGFISSPIEEKSRFIYALQQQISDMIMQFNGVVSVNTNVSMPITDDILSNDHMSSAAVLVKYKSGYNMTMYVSKIKRLVTNSVPGLSGDNVEVTMVPVYSDN
ncbi:MAG: type III secretion inner membrane ring lipoprotein SctJ [Burkholderiales bacterium]|nr:type III secretion inner membrane ring lipoprotein SctJ [Burkholderiales bacterium]